MDKEKIKLIIRNMELLVDSLKAEVYSDTNAPPNRNAEVKISDYDEIFEDEY